MWTMVGAKGAPKQGLDGMIIWDANVSCVYRTPGRSPIVLSVWGNRLRLLPAITGNSGPPRRIYRLRARVARPDLHFDLPVSYPLSSGL